MSDQVIGALRSFNRFYTRHVGALDASFLGTGLTLPEARALYEIATRDGATAADIADELGLDPGFLSRIVRRLLTANLIERGRASDARRRPLRLTDAGGAAFARLDRLQLDWLSASLGHLADTETAELVGALSRVHALLAGTAEPVTIRAFGPGDMGAIVAAQARYYAATYGWTRGMERLLLEVTADFLEHRVPGRSDCWIADCGGRPVGSVFCFDAGGGVAQLRLMYVDAAVRGRGVGGELLDRCIAFARDAGYREMTLWTHTALAGARRLYARAGFILVATEMHSEFGEPVQGETWRMPLAH